VTVAASPRSALPWLVAAAAAQVALLAAASPGGALGDAALCAVVLAAPIAIAQRRPQRWSQAAAIAGALGGLGMLLGARLDGAALPACHGGGGVFNGMTGGMLLGCVAGCLWLMPACRGARPWLGHAACFVGMLLGMALGARWLPGVLDAMVTPPATHHIAMALGMMLGAGGGTRAIHEEAALDPPGPLTSSTLRLGRAGQAALPARPRAQLRRAADP
jgi:hypothetical protein